MVASHDHGPVAALSLVVQSENGMRAFPTLGRAGICGCVERGAQAPLPKVDGWRAAGDLGSPSSGFGLAAVHEVVAAHLVARLDEVGRHRAAHVAKTDETDRRHAASRRFGKA